MSNVLNIQNVTKQFGSKKAVNNISIELKSGEIYGFLGPNGAGKTTTIRMVMDFIRPDVGTIELFGANGPKSLAAARKEVGFLSADSALYSDWNARRHIKYLESVRGAKTEALKLAKRFNLDLGTPYKHLSSGNQQKLALILAIMHQPKLLILDEPTRGLDPLWQEEIYDILRDFRTAGGAVFMSSHNLSEVQKICDHVGIIKDGKMVASQTMDSLRKIHTHQVSAEFQDEINIVEFKDIKHAEIIKSSSKSIMANVTGDLNEFMNAINKHKLHDLEVTHASVEETFLRHYR